MDRLAHSAEERLAANFSARLLWRLQLIQMGLHWVPTSQCWTARFGVTLLPLTVNNTLRISFTGSLRAYYQTAFACLLERPIRYAIHSKTGQKIFLPKHRAVELSMSYLYAASCVVSFRPALSCVEWLQACICVAEILVLELAT